MARRVGLRTDEQGQGILLFIPFILGIIFVIAGILLITSGSLGTGLIVLGVGVLILGAGGSATLGYGLLRVAGPTGFIIIVLGIIAMALTGT